VSTTKKYYAIDVFGLLTDKGYSQQDALTAWTATQFLADLLAEESVAAIQTSFGSAELVTKQNPGNANLFTWKQAVVSGEVESSVVDDFVETLLSAAESQVQGEEGEAFFEDILSYVIAMGEGISTPQEPDTELRGWFPPPYNIDYFFHYPPQLPFLVFESVLNSAPGGSGGSQEAFPQEGEEYPCQIDENGDVSILVPVQHEVMPELLNSGAEITIKAFERFDGSGGSSPAPPSGPDNPIELPQPGPGDPAHPGKLVLDPPSGPGNPDPAPVPPSGPGNPETVTITTRTASVQETSDGLKLVTCEDLSPYATSLESILSATITINQVGVPGCPDEGGGEGGGGNGPGETGGGNGGADRVEATGGTLALLGLTAGAAVAYISRH
jgi:hypothetical protein